MTRADALRRIRHLAGDSVNVVFRPHAKAQMRRRGITPLEVLNVLRHGGITEGPALDLKGCWRCTMQRFAAGENVTTAVAICDTTVVIVTAF
jgi:Domain of unknown function (DUF4258)